MRVSGLGFRVEGLGFGQTNLRVVTWALDTVPYLLERVLKHGPLVFFGV